MEPFGCEGDIAEELDYMLQIYTGPGKGKTTAAIGLAVRALGAGMKVYMMQFMKSLAYSEQKILRGFAPQLKLVTTGKPFFIAEEGVLSEEEKDAWGKDVVIFPQGRPPADYAALLCEGLRQAICESEGFEVIILDEINVALHFGLLQREELEPWLSSKSQRAEIICTGRKAPEWMLAQADLITEMKEVRHYYARGIEARRGIEN